MDSDFEYVHDFNVDDGFGYDENQFNSQRSIPTIQEQLINEQALNVQNEIDFQKQPVEANEQCVDEQETSLRDEYVHNFNVDDGFDYYDNFEAQSNSQKSISPIQEQLINEQQTSANIRLSPISEVQEQLIEEQQTSVDVRPQPTSSVQSNNEHRTPVNARPPPILDIHAQFSMKVLKTQNITPMPNYKSMMDEELNDHLDKFGIRPMGRKRAIDELTRIYEATHPIIDATTTPTRERVWSTISECADKPRKKPAVSRKRPAPPEFDQPSAEINKPPTLQELTGEILRWLRMPQNYELYNECLMMKSIMMDRLVEVFNPVLREKSISKEVFIRILDHLHISYSEPRGENNHYYN